MGGGGAPTSVEGALAAMTAPILGALGGIQKAVAAGGRVSASVVAQLKDAAHGVGSEMYSSVAEIVRGVDAYQKASHAVQEARGKAQGSGSSSGRGSGGSGGSGSGGRAGGGGSGGGDSGGSAANAEVQRAERALKTARDKVNEESTKLRSTVDSLLPSSVFSTSSSSSTPS